MSNNKNGDDLVMFHSDICEEIFISIQNELYNVKWIGGKNIFDHLKIPQIPKYQKFLKGKLFMMDLEKSKWPCGKLLCQSD